MAENERKSGWLKVWEFLQTIGFGALILSLQGSIKGALEDLGKKAGETAGKKVGEALGLDSAGAEKTDDDEISVRKVLTKGSLSQNKKNIFKEWLGRLRNSNPKLASEFTRRIHNILVKTTRQTEVESGTKDKPKKKNIMDDTDAIKIAEDLILDIINATDDYERLRILAQENIKVVPPKAAPAVDATKKFFKEKVVGGENANRQNFNETTASWAEKAKAWRESR